MAKDQERRQQAGALYTLLNEKTAWLAPEILELGEAKVRAFERENAELAKRHGFFVDNTLRAAPHTLGLEAEGVLAAAGDVLQQPNSVYHQLANSELPFPTVTLSNGASVVLDQSGYVQHRQSENRADRKLVFDTFWGAWKGYEGTAGAVLTAQIMGDIFRAKTRKHKNALSAALNPDNMPEAVYRTLVAEANQGLPALHRYFGLRKRLLGIEGPLEYYDIYPIMFPGIHEPKFTISDSERVTLEALVPYGEEYLAFLREGFAGGWTDPYPRKHKASGAYMNGSAYDVHPYVLLNHQDDYNSLSTFAHEWGHAVHTQLTTKYQPYETSHYSTFVAEAASIANEMLLNDYMVKHAKTREEKLFYLGEGVEIDPRHLLPPGDACGVRACDPRGDRRGPSAVGRAHERALSRNSAQILRRSRRRDDDRREVWRRMGVYPALLLQFLRLPICDVDRGRGALHRCYHRRRQARGRAVPYAAARGRLRLSLRALQARRHRYGVARALSGADRAHEPHHGRHRKAAALTQPA